MTLADVDVDGNYRLNYPSILLTEDKILITYSPSKIDQFWSLENIEIPLCIFDK